MCTEREEGQNERGKINMEERNERKGGRKGGDMSPYTSVAVLKSKMNKSSTGKWMNNCLTNLRIDVMSHSGIIYFTKKGEDWLT